MKCFNWNSSSVPVLIHDNITFDTNGDKVDTLNSFLSAALTTLSHLYKRQGCCFHTQSYFYLISYAVCTEEEVSDILQSLDPIKDNGNDYIFACMLKSTADASARSVTKLFYCQSDAPTFQVTRKMQSLYLYQRSRELWTLPTSDPYLYFQSSVRYSNGTFNF